MQRVNAYAIASCLGLLALAFVPQARADEWDQTTTLRVNQPVQIPGKVLQPGDYVLKLEPSVLENREIVQFYNSDQTQLLDTVIAVPRIRAKAAAESQFTFWEMAAGQPPALRTWYYPGRNVGHEFTYPKDFTNKIAQYNPNRVPRIAEQTADLNTATMGTVTGYGEFRPAKGGTTTAAAAAPGQPVVRTDQGVYAPIPAGATVTAEVLPPFPIATEQPCGVTAQPQAVTPTETCPCGCAPSAAVTAPGSTTTTTTVQPQVQQPSVAAGVGVAGAPGETAVQPQAGVGTTTTVQPVTPSAGCPPTATTTQPGMIVQPRTDETGAAIQAQPVQPVEAQPCPCPMATCPPSTTMTQPGVTAQPGVTTQPGVTVQPGVTAQPGVTVQPGVTTQPGVTVQPRTDENVQPAAPATQPACDCGPAAPAQANQPCDCQGPTSQQMEPNTSSNSAATPMVNHSVS